MEERIPIHVDEDDVLTYFISKKPWVGNTRIMVHPDELVRWYRVFADFEEVQEEIGKYVESAMDGEQA